MWLVCSTVNLQALLSLYTKVNTSRSANFPCRYLIFTPQTPTHTHICPIPVNNISAPSPFIPSVYPLYFDPSLNHNAPPIPTIPTPNRRRQIHTLFPPIHLPRPAPPQPPHHPSPKQQPQIPRRGPPFRSKPVSGYGSHHGGP